MPPGPPLTLSLWPPNPLVKQLLPSSYEDEQACGGPGARPGTRKHDFPSQPSLPVLAVQPETSDLTFPINVLEAGFLPKSAYERPVGERSSEAVRLWYSLWYSSARRQRGE